MKRRPQSKEQKSIRVKTSLSPRTGDIGIVLSGGGSRAAYQVGALKALAPYLMRDPDNISVIVGSSIGAINGLILGACLEKGLDASIHALEEMWKQRTFRNTFLGTPSQAFVRAIKMAFWQYMSPGPNPTNDAIFDPTPLMEEVDRVIMDHGGLHPNNRDPKLHSVAVMTTIEGAERKPLLFLSSHREVDPEIMQGASFEICHIDSMTAKHGFASAALPSVLPPVELDTQHGTVRLVDGGISQNVPVDPAARLGAKKVILVDISGRHWWLDKYNEPHDTRPSWEVPAGHSTFCVRPPDTFIVRNIEPFGPLLKDAVGASSKKFITAVGPTWPVYKLLKTKLGQDVAYETMSYVALDPDYLTALIERGYNETMRMLRNRTEIAYVQHDTMEEVAQAI